jgi:hypothetical protein
MVIELLPPDMLLNTSNGGMLNQPPLKAEGVHQGVFFSFTTRKGVT